MIQMNVGNILIMNRAIRIKGVSDIQMLPKLIINNKKVMKVYNQKNHFILIILQIH